MEGLLKRAILSQRVVSTIAKALSTPSEICDDDSDGPDGNDGREVRLGLAENMQALLVEAGRSWVDLVVEVAEENASGSCTDNVAETLAKILEGTLHCAEDCQGQGFLPPGLGIEDKDVRKQAVARLFSHLPSWREFGPCFRRVVAQLA